ncbi:hypothetical protein PVL29_022165 [Vitis rotundifolia]|uniref:Uncharacterized protein n=1 Tax=Vitis rotundifolia TaxID=103349 RepID=A0AA38YV12_VITRO|nr:hypothetical protein PVL29_022165 [Vitis rotundifolia]
MSLTIAGTAVARVGVGLTTTSRSTHLPIRRHFLLPSLPFTLITTTTRSRTSHIVFAKKLSSRTGRFDSKNRRSGTTTKEGQQEQREEAEIKEIGSTENVGVADGDDDDDGYFLPELPGDKPDFWEGPQWDALGFFVQYMWAFGIVFALIACGIAVVTYNEGATDFKKTPAYQESVQSRELLEEPETSNSDVFESNPTEEAPSLE